MLKDRIDQLLFGNSFISFLAVYDEYSFTGTDFSKILVRKLVEFVVIFSEWSGSSTFAKIVRPFHTSKVRWTVD